MFLSKEPLQVYTYLCDLVGDVVRAVLDLWSDDGFLGGRRGGALLLVVGLGEVERDERDLVDGAVLVEVGVRGGAQQAGFNLAERSWRTKGDTRRRRSIKGPASHTRIRLWLIVVIGERGYMGIEYGVALTQHNTTDTETLQPFKASH